MGDLAAGFISAFVISILLGGPVIRLLKRLGARQTVSADAPSRHIEKQGTPTMGGVLILIGVAIPVVLEALRHKEPSPPLALLILTLAFGLIGFVDDLLIARRGKNLGLKARQKLALQFLFAIAFVGWLHANAAPGLTSVVKLAGVGQIDLGVWYYALGAVFIVGMSNAINLTDGLDGLAGGVSAMIALALAVTVFHNGWQPFFGGAVAGACAGFLWYNCHPAQVFMGDTGSLALGAALSGLAMLGKREVEYQAFAIIPWVETLAVMIQVTVFRWRRVRHGIEYARAHRVFRRTPLHHHYEELSWRETKIVARFWLVTAAAILAMIAVADVLAGN